MTYPLHIILRFELEQALFDGTVTVEDLPSIWNKKVNDMLGLTVESNKLGVLQDVHWSMGALGHHHYQYHHYHYQYHQRFIDV